MKTSTIIICLALCFAGFSSYSQVKPNIVEKKDTIKQPISPEIEQLKLASLLIQDGLKNQSPLSLIRAAEMLSSLSPNKWKCDSVIVSDNNKTAKTETKFTLDPQKLLNEAKRMSKSDSICLKLIAKVESKQANTTRGNVAGARVDERYIEPNGSVTYYERFWKGESAIVSLVGSGGADLDLYIYDMNGNLISKDDDYTTECIVSFLPYYTTTFRIKVINRSSYWGYYGIATN